MTSVVLPPNTVTVVGAGSWGTAAAHILSHKCETVYLWAARSEIVAQIKETGRNQEYLPGVDLRPNVLAINRLESGLLDSPLFVWAIPIEFLRERLRMFAPHLRKNIIAVNLGKGIEEGSSATPSEILSQECSDLRAFGSLVGPNIASEVAAGMYAQATLGLSEPGCLDAVAACFSTDTFRVETTTDVRGIEIGAALKNMCAIAAGLCDGLALGANTKSLVIAESIAEIRDIGAVLGAEPRTLESGGMLADLLTSSYSLSGRNRRVGEYLGAGNSLEGAMSLLGGRVAEGVATCRACYGLQVRLGLSFPVIDSLNALLNGECSANACVHRILLGRPTQAPGSAGNRGVTDAAGRSHGRPAPSLVN